MSSYIKLAVIAPATPTIPPVLSAPNQYGYGNLLVEFKGWAYPMMDFDLAVNVFRRVELPRSETDSHTSSFHTSTGGSPPFTHDSSPDSSSSSTHSPHADKPFDPAKSPFSERPFKENPFQKNPFEER